MVPVVIIQQGAGFFWFLLAGYVVSDQFGDIELPDGASFDFVGGAAVVMTVIPLPGFYQIEQAVVTGCFLSEFTA